MGFSAWVDDGYNETRTISEIPGIHPAATITFRVMTREDLAAFMQKIDKGLETAVASEVANELAARITKWDVTKGDEARTLVEPTAKNLLRLRPAFFKRLENIVFGWDPGDAAKREADAKN